MLIRIEQVHFSYPDGIQVLKGVSLTIHPGEAVALVGANGSGKTTLARHLNGLLRPQAGQVWIGDWQTAEHSPAQLARRVAYVFQNPDEQIFHRRLWDEVAFGPQNLGYPREKVKAYVDQALALVGLGDAAQDNPHDLGYSGRKRIALASALAMQTPILVLDEPTAGLDARELAQLGDIVRHLHQEGKTILIITHDLDFVAEHLERIILLHQGQLRLDAPAHEFFTCTDVLQATQLLPPQLVRLGQRLGDARPSLTVEQFLENRKKIL